MSKLKNMIAKILVVTMLLSIMPLNTHAAGNDIENLKEEFADKYSGVDLISKNFNRNIMTYEESEAYDALLELMYYENELIASEEGYSKEEYIKFAEDILSEKIELNSYTQGNITYYSTSHGTISTKLLGGILNGVIDATILVTGAGSVYSLIKQMGKEAAKDWIEKNVKKAIVNKLKAIGLGTVSAFAGSIVGNIVNAYYDPGQWLAEKIDGRDLIPNNGYIELW